MTKPYCCYISLEDVKCGADATWEICWGETDVDYSHSCDAHVGELLMEDKANTVYPIEWAL